MEMQERIKKELENKKNMFNRNTFDYFSSLVNLEISAVNQKYFTEEDLKLYRNFDIYNKIVNFNIPERTLKIVGDVNTKYNDLKLDVSEDRNEFNINFDRGPRILPIIGYKYNKDNNEITLRDFYFDNELHDEKIENIRHLIYCFSDHTSPSDIIVGSPYRSPFFEEEKERMENRYYFQKLYDEIDRTVITEGTKSLDENTNEIIKDIRSKILSDYGMEELDVNYFEKTDLLVPQDRFELFTQPTTSLEPSDKLYKKNNSVAKVKRIIHIP